MRSDMKRKNLFPPIFVTYPYYDDLVRVVLFNEERPTEWEKVKEYLEINGYINNRTARDITGIVQTHEMSRLFKKWTEKGLLVKIEPKSKNPKNIKYRLSNS